MQCSWVTFHGSFKECGDLASSFDDITFSWKVLSRDVFTFMYQGHSNLCRILVPFFGITFTKTCVTCQRHVESSMHGGMLLLYNRWNFVIWFLVKPIKKTFLPGSLLIYDILWKVLSRVLQVMSFSGRTLKGIIFLRRKFQVRNVLILRNLQDPWKQSIFRNLEKFNDCPVENVFPQKFINQKNRPWIITWWTNNPGTAQVGAARKA